MSAGKHKWDSIGCRCIQCGLERRYVFEERNVYADDGGPMVRWFNGGACNGYLETGDVIWVDGGLGKSTC